MGESLPLTTAATFTGATRITGKTRADFRRLENSDRLLIVLNTAEARLTGCRIDLLRLAVTIGHVKWKGCGAEAAAVAAVGPGRHHAISLIAPTPDVALRERRRASGCHTFPCRATSAVRPKP